MNHSLKMSQYRNSAPSNADQILRRHLPGSDESRKNWFVPPNDHLDCHGCKHNSGYRGSYGRGREDAKKQDDDAERTLMQGGQQPAEGKVILGRLPKEVR
jgi:hypothetical protein